MPFLSLKIAYSPGKKSLCFFFMWHLRIPNNCFLPSLDILSATFLVFLSRSLDFWMCSLTCFLGVSILRFFDLGAPFSSSEFPAKLKHRGIRKNLQCQGFF